MFTSLTHPQCAFRILIGFIVRSQLVSTLDRQFTWAAWLFLDDYATNIKLDALATMIAFQNPSLKTVLLVILSIATH